MKRKGLFLGLFFLSAGLLIGILFASKLDIMPAVESLNTEPEASVSAEQPLTSASSSWFGITVQSLTDDLAKAFGIPNTDGVLVATLIEGGPAQKAGFQEGDVIIKLDGAPVKTIEYLASFVKQTQVGSNVKVVVIRGQKEVELRVVVGQKPQRLPEELKTGQPKDMGGWRGLDVVGLSPDLARYLGVEGKEGVVVINISSASPAEESGMAAGDLICQMNGQPVSGLDDYQKLAAILQGNILIKAARGFFIIKEGAQQ